MNRRTFVARTVVFGLGAAALPLCTCIESRDETYAVMEAVDTRYLKFGPDIGQLQKGGMVQGIAFRS